jgi:hypothetical protein
MELQGEQDALKADRPDAELETTGVDWEPRDAERVSRGAARR